MVSTRFGLKRETPFEGSNPPPTVMTNTYTLQQLQNHIMEMEQRHEEELRKLKVDHDQLEARVRHSQDNELSTHTFLEHTQVESHP